jgi:hypothetical protein
VLGGDLAALEAIEKRVEDQTAEMTRDFPFRLSDVEKALLADRPAARPGSEGRVDDRFAYDRSRLLESVREEAREAVLHYDAPSEARRLPEKVRESVAQAALLQVSALGLGTIVAALASITAADVTGILAAGVLSLVSLFLLPARREKARRSRPRSPRSARSSWPRSPRASSRNATAPPPACARRLTVTGSRTSSARQWA